MMLPPARMLAVGVTSVKKAGEVGTDVGLFR
jgi:hypothetical protein